MAHISYNDIAKLVREMTRDKKGKELDEAVKNLVRFLARVRLLSKTSLIFSKLEEIIHNEKHEILVTVKSVAPLKTQEKNHIIDFVNKKYDTENVIINEQIVPDLLGGFRIEIGNDVLDLSLRHRVKKLEAYLKK